MRHAFVPLEHVPYRCAKCLRQIDCAPHLPVAPGLQSLAQAMSSRMSRWPGSQRPAVSRYQAEVNGLAVSRAAR